MLPIGTLREQKEVGFISVCTSRSTEIDRGLQGYEEVTIPPATMVLPRAMERLIPVAELVPLARRSFSVSCKTHLNFQMLRFLRTIPH